MSKFYDTISLELHRYAPELNKVYAGATVLLKPYDPLLNPKGLKFDELHLWSNYRPLKQTKQYLRRPEHFGRPRVGRYVRLEVYYTSDTPYKVYAMVYSNSGTLYLKTNKNEQITVQLMEI